MITAEEVKSRVAENKLGCFTTKTIRLKLKESGFKYRPLSLRQTYVGTEHAISSRRHYA